MQNPAHKLKNELKQIEMKEAQRAKICAKIIWELEDEKCTKYFFQKLEQRKNGNQAIFSLKSRQSDKVLKYQQEILTEVKHFYEHFYGQKNNVQEWIEIDHSPLVIGWNGQNQSNKQVNFNSKHYGPKSSNMHCFQETPRFKKTDVNAIRK